MHHAHTRTKPPQPSDQVNLQPAVPMVFSIGYEGKTLDAFIALLKAALVERLIDVRDAPFSRKPGFSKAPLEQALRAANIEYIGIPKLGTDKASRDRYSSDADMAGLLQEYRRKLERNVEHYERAKRLARERPSAIMCYEADSKNCHRQVIEERMAADGFRIVHLGDKPHTRPEKTFNED